MWVHLLFAFKTSDGSGYTKGMQHHLSLKVFFAEQAGH